MVIISQHIRKSKHQVVPVKCFVNYTSIKLKQKIIQMIYIFFWKNSFSPVIKKSYLQIQFLSMIHVIPPNILIVKIKSKSGTKEKLQFTI